MNLGALPQRPLPAAVDGSEANATARRATRQILFFATHLLSPVDLRIFRHYSRQLRYASPPSFARLWLLLYQPAADGVHPLPHTSREIEAGACAWGDGALRLALPAVAASAAVAASSTPNANHRRYFWFHSSLLLWNRTFGYAYPSVRYWWRIEPDVLFAGSWSSLVRLAERRPTDLVLPQLTSHEAQPSYSHWVRNRHFLKQRPRREWVYSLVSIGRYSRHFMELMTSKWAAGITAYEEILLPMSCTERVGCTRETFHRLRSPGWRKTHVADFFRYRPEWSCETFLMSAAANTQELWHPVKHRECWADYLDSCTAKGCAKVKSPEH
ncbi:hypothetical protein AB1Y20_017849 [Prymnesium parvum]|uniref:Hexosyltransferase n=1 Tax=Prymnesium parvum TaxID=97485 RepID=A0AB34JLQ9_PRYPA